MFIDAICENKEIILAVAFGLLFSWNTILETRLRKERKRTTSFFRGKNTKDLEEVISEILRKQRSAEENINQVLEKVRKLDEVALRSIQKVGVIRFNPFQDLGGNQSFILALLDQKDNGVVLSSYYSKDGTRTYTKPIENGESKFQLAEEEEKAIKKAISS